MENNYIKNSPEFDLCGSGKLAHELEIFLVFLKWGFAALVGIARKSALVYNCSVTGGAVSGGSCAAGALVKT